MSVSPDAPSLNARMLRVRGHCMQSPKTIISHIRRQCGRLDNRLHKEPVALTVSIHIHAQPADSITGSTEAPNASIINLPL